MKLYKLNKLEYHSVYRSIHMYGEVGYIGRLRQ
jgi:hypothetical protein